MQSYTKIDDLNGVMCPRCGKEHANIIFCRQCTHHLEGRAEYLLRKGDRAASKCRAALWKVGVHPRTDFTMGNTEIVVSIDLAILGGTESLRKLIMDKCGESAGGIVMSGNVATFRISRGWMSPLDSKNH